MQACGRCRGTSNALRTACRQAFADSRGWRWNRKAWTADLSEDARGSNGARFIHHPEFFDSLNERKVALVTHSYAPAQEIADYPTTQHAAGTSRRSYLSAGGTHASVAAVAASSSRARRGVKWK